MGSCGIAYGESSFLALPCPAGFIFSPFIFFLPILLLFCSFIVLSYCFSPTRLFNSCENSHPAERREMLGRIYRGFCGLVSFGLGIFFRAEGDEE